MILVSDTLYIIPALLFFIFSQLISTYRLQLFFRQINLNISNRSNIILYLIGMFYNFFIPGGIGGDAYKVYILHKSSSIKIGKLSTSVLMDRISGLIGIALTSLFLLMFMKTSIINIIVLLFLIVFIFLGSIRLVGILKKDFKTAFKVSLLYSFFVQSAQVISVYFLVLALKIEHQQIIYLLIFLVSSVLSIVSFSGIGAREYVYMKASEFYNFNEETGVAIGLLFTGITCLVSLFGIFYVFKSSKQLISLFSSNTHSQNL